MIILLSAGKSFKLEIRLDGVAEAVTIIQVGIGLYWIVRYILSLL